MNPLGESCEAALMHPPLPSPLGTGTSLPGRVASAKEKTWLKFEDFQVCPGLGCVVLQFLRCVLLSEWSNLVEVLLLRLSKITGHFMSKIIFWRLLHEGLRKRRSCRNVVHEIALGCTIALCGKIGLGSLDQLVEQQLTCCQPAVKRKEAA